MEARPDVPRVLVVDDDEIIRNAVAEALELEGYAVASATNGAEALALVRQQCPRAIVLDLMMPRMDGLEFLRQCRVHALCEGAAVLVISASRHLPQAAMDLGVTACFAKPFDLNALLGTVERVVWGG